MGYFPVRYDSRVVIYESKMFIRLATGHTDVGAMMTRKNILNYNENERVTFEQEQKR